MSPESIDSLVSQADALRAIGRYDDAIVLMQRALTIDPENYGSFVTLGLAQLGAATPKAALDTHLAPLRFGPKRRSRIASEPVPIGRSAENARRSTKQIGLSHSNPISRHHTSCWRKCSPSVGSATRP